MPSSITLRVADQARATIFFAALAFCAAVPDAAIAQEDFYKGKTVRLVVGNPPGGGTGAYSHLIARHLKKHIPGGPNVNVENMVGAGTLVATNYVANVGPQDGTVVAIVGAAIPFSPLLGVKEAQFDAAKLNWLPSPISDVSGVTVWHSVPVNSMEDARKRELILASANEFSTSSYYARIITAVTGVRFKLIHGYNGTEPAYLAMEKGEVDGHPSASRAGLRATRPDWIRDNKVKILVQYGRAPSPELPNTPFLRDLARTEDDKLLVDVAVAPLAIGWPIFVGPKVPPDRVALLRKAFMDTYKDEELLAEAARMGNVEFSPDPMTGEEVQALIVKTYAAPEPVLNRLRVLYQASADAR